MADPFVRRRGKNGGKNRPSKDIEPPHRTTNTARLADEAGVYYECFQEETREGYLIPRKSLSEAQHLATSPKPAEFKDDLIVRRLQKDRVTGKLVETSDPKSRMVWRPERTLLRRGLPDNFGEGRGSLFTRVTSRTKTRRIEIELKDTPDTIVRIGRPTDDDDPLNSI